jgi:hypothetical protein
MLSSPKTVAPHQEATAAFEPSRHTPAGHALPHAPHVGGGVVAAPGAGKAQCPTTASPAPVLITEHQVMFATAAAGAASHTAAVSRPWLIPLGQRLSLHSDAERQQRRYYARRPSYIERAAMAREMERL